MLCPVFRPEQKNNSFYKPYQMTNIDYVLLLKDFVIHNQVGQDHLEIYLDELSNWKHHLLHLYNTTMNPVEGNEMEVEFDDEH